MNNTKKATQPPKKIAPKAQNTPAKAGAHTTATAPAKKAGPSGLKK